LLNDESRLINSYTMKTGNNWGVGILILRSDGKTLIGKRTDNHLWCTPGGKVNIGETVLKGIIREVKEEVNLNIHSPELFDIHVGSFGNEKVWITFSFYTDDYSGTIRPQAAEMEELKWVNILELLSLDLFLPTKMMLDKYLELHPEAVSA